MKVLKQCLIGIFFSLFLACTQTAGVQQPSVETLESVEQSFITVRNRVAELINATSLSDSDKNNAETWRTAYGKTDSSKILWTDLASAGNHGSNLETAYKRIYTIARVYSFNGKSWEKSPEYLAAIKDCLTYLQENYYHINKVENGNWWQWEIGIPKILNDILCLIYNELTAEEIATYLQPSFWFQPDPRYNGGNLVAAAGSSSTAKRDSLGGNLADTASISFLRGALLANEAEVNAAISSLDNMNTYVTIGEGFYNDGSFLQHDTIPYIGTYGEVVLNGLGRLQYLANGTAFNGIKTKSTVVYESILKSLPRLFINGGINDSVSGRAIGRTGASDTDLERGRFLIISLALLVQTAPEQYKNSLKQLIKTAVAGNKEYLTTSKVYNTIQKNILESVMNDSSIVAGEQSGGIIFYDMDRAVYKAPSGASFVVAMHSSRIGNYETMNGENKQGWHTGDGMTYIYGSKSTAYTDFWVNVDKFHLAGTTESTAFRADASGERRSAGKMSPATFVGGVKSDNALLAAMDFFSHNDKTKAKKSWFFVDRIMVALGSGLTSTDSGEIHTTIENRKAASITPPPPATLGADSSFQITDDSGDIFSYKLLGGTTAEVTLNVISNVTYATAIINHGTSPTNKTYAYTAAPLITKETLENFSKNVTIITQTEKIHAISYNNITAINFFAGGADKAGIFAADKSVSIIAEKYGSNYTLFISNSARVTGGITLTVSGNFSAISSEAITVANTNNTTVITIYNTTANAVKVSLYAKS